MDLDPQRVVKNWVTADLQGMLAGVTGPREFPYFGLAPNPTQKIEKPNPYHG